MRDKVVVATLILAFATFVTAHVALAARLVMRARPRWRGLVALVVPPLAPWWGVREGMRGGAAIWVGAVVVYAVARVLA